MGFSREQAEALGITKLLPPGDAWAEAGEKVGLPRRIATNELGQNKTESQFDAYLSELKADGRISGYWFEPVKLRIAGNTFYKIDFLVRRLNGSLAGIEIKGFMRDDAAIKIKDAAEDHPWLDVYLVRRDRKCHAGWDVRPVTRTGIGRHPIGKDWHLC